MSEYDPLEMEMAKGLSLTPADARLLQSEISRQPDDLRKRLKLLAYQNFTERLAPEEFEFFLENLSWCIATIPYAELLSRSDRGIRSDGPEDAYATIAERWIFAADGNPEDPRVAHNAATFLAFHYPQVCLDILVRSVDYGGAEVEGYLRLLCDTFLCVLERDRASHQNIEVLVEMLCDTGILSGTRLELRLPLAELAFKFGEMEKAKQYLEFHLDQDDEKKTQSLSDDRHRAHLLLGQIAIAEGDVFTAKKELLRATGVPDTLHLKIVGPNMSLARELLRVGERETVIEYIKRWRGRWPVIGEVLLTRWEDDIRRTGESDFSTDFNPWDI